MRQVPVASRMRVSLAQDRVLTYTPGVSAGDIISYG